MIEQNTLKLSLRTDKNAYVRSESIKSEVTLLNNSAYAINIEDLTVLNNSVYFNAINNLGSKFSGSLQSPRIRDGLKPPPIRKKSMVLLQPKTQRVINVDLLSIFGELPEGDYKVRATYSSEGILEARSETIFFKVSKSAPTYSKTYQDYLRATSHPIRTTWINKEEDGLYLFIMESSQYSPLNIRSNRRILKVDEIQKVYSSILASSEQDVEHLLWNQGDILTVAIIDHRVLQDAKTISLPVHIFQILEPSFTDEEGKLHLVGISKQDEVTVFQLMTYLSKDKMEVEEICRFSGNFTKYSVIFDEESKLHLAWASESGDIFYTWFDLEKHSKAGGEPKILTTSKPPTLDLQLSKACEDDEGNLQLLLHFADYESPKEFHSHLINVDTGETVLHSFFPLSEKQSLVLIQTVLDLECKPHYLFQDRLGALWFKALEGAELVGVTEEGETYPGNVDFPMLLVSSNMTRHYGIYLRYIKDKSTFVYKQLESLT